MRRVIGLSLVAVTLGLGACRSATAPAAADVVHAGNVVQATGTVVWSPIEGGFYALRVSEGATYDPVNLPEAFRVNGLRVRFQGRVLSDAVGIHMAGPIIELDTIEKL